MQSTMEKVSTNKVKLRMELPAEAFEEAMQKAYLKMRGRVNVPGFRKGKAPRKLIERMYGESIFYEEAFDQVFPGLYEEAVTAHGIEAVGQPDVDIEEIGGGKALVATAEVFVKPEVALGAYKGLDIERDDDTVDDDAVEAELGRVRERNAREEEVTDRAVQDDDIVTLDYLGTVDGVAFDGGTAEGQKLTIGSGQFIPGFEEQMVGMAIGEEKDLTVTFPKEYHAEELAGKDAVFHVKVSAIRTHELPALDDDFAQDVSEFDTLAAYKADIKAKLEKDAVRRADNAYENALVEAIVEKSEMDVPQPMIDREVENMLRDFSMRMMYQGISLEQFLQYTGQTMDDLRGERREDAEKRVKGQLVLEAVKKAEGIEASEADIEDVVVRYAEGSGKSAEEFKQGLTEQQMEYIKEDASTIATLNFLKKENAKA